MVHISKTAVSVRKEEEKSERTKKKRERERERESYDVSMNKLLMMNTVKTIHFRKKKEKKER